MSVTGDATFAANSVTTGSTLSTGNLSVKDTKFVVTAASGNVFALFAHLSTVDVVLVDVLVDVDDVNVVEVDDDDVDDAELDVIDVMDVVDVLVVVVSHPLQVLAQCVIFAT